MTDHYLELYYARCFCCDAEGAVESVEDAACWLCDRCVHLALTDGGHEMCQHAGYLGELIMSHPWTSDRWCLSAIRLLHGIASAVIAADKARRRVPEF